MDNEDKENERPERYIGYDNDEKALYVEFIQTP